MPEDPPADEAWDEDDELCTCGHFLHHHETVPVGIGTDLDTPELYCIRCGCNDFTTEKEIES